MASVARIERWSTPIEQLIAGGVLGLSLGIANLVELYFHDSKWLSVCIKGIVGALTGIALACLLREASDQMAWYFLGGMIFGASSRLWIQHINF